LSVSPRRDETPTVSDFIAPPRRHERLREKLSYHAGKWVGRCLAPNPPGLQLTRARVRVDPGAPSSNWIICVQQRSSVTLCVRKQWSVDMRRVTASYLRAAAASMDKTISLNLRRRRSLSLRTIYMQKVSKAMHMMMQHSFQMSDETPTNW